MKEKFNKNFGAISNYTAALILLSFGVLYFFRGSFMPYHSQAVERPWEEVDHGMQILLIVFMRAVAGGFMAVALAIILLQRQFDKTKLDWIPGIIFIVGFVSIATTLYATVIVQLNTPGRPPTALASIGLVGLILGYIYNRKKLKE